jgi:hypothetical protein
MAKERTRSRPIHLNYRSVKQVLVEPEDQDRFMMTAKEAARACKQAEDEKGWVDRFNEFLIFLGEWCKAHSADVAAGYVDIGDGGLDILICTEGAGYREDFEDTLTDLDLDIVKKFPWCVAEVAQIPCKAKEGQMSFERAILVYGDGKRAPETGDS